MSVNVKEKGNSANDRSHKYCNGPRIYEGVTIISGSILVWLRKEAIEIYCAKSLVFELSQQLLD